MKEQVGKIPACCRGPAVRSARRSVLWGQHSEHRTPGFTLVELMVALALAAMISVSIMFISSQARDAYDGTVKKVDVFNRFRFGNSDLCIKYLVYLIQCHDAVVKVPNPFVNHTISF